MNVWKLVGANKLECSETENPAPEENKIRVRITKVLVDGTDAMLYSGAIKTKYPLIPGRYAVGLVTEEGNERFPKNTRVLLHAIVDAPDSGTQKKDFSEDDFLLRGRTADGYLRDIVYCSPSEITPLPDAVNDEHALTLHHVALAKAALDKLGAQKGQHVAVVGAGLLGVLVCQLLIYQQSAPILIDADPARLEFARTCGVYYTMQADETLTEKIAAVTGGRLVSGAVYITGSKGGGGSLPFSVCANHANVVLCGSMLDGLTVDLSAGFRKSLSLFCVTGRENLYETAINLVANQATNTDNYAIRVVKADDAANYLASYYDAPERDLKEIGILTLI